MYRAIAWKIREGGMEQEEGESLIAFIRSVHLDLEGSGPGQRVWVDGQDLAREIRRPEISQLASILSARPEVRLVLTEKQRQLGAARGLVAEGRDMGTVVFPGADVKFFLLASLEVRAERRYKELTAAGDRVSLDQVLQDLSRRDRRDSERPLAPLKAADDAMAIDTSRLSIDQVLKVMLSRIVSRSHKG